MKLPQRSARNASASRLAAASLGLALAAGVTPARDARAEPGAPPAAAAAGLDPKIGSALPLNTPFRTSRGGRVQLGDVLGQGKPGLLVLAYNRCQLLCSLVLRSTAKLVTQLDLRPGKDFALVTISIDPRETVDEAARLQASLLDAAGLPERADEPAPPWTFLVGERPAIDAVADAVGFRYAWDSATEQYAHPAALITLSPRGVVTGYFEGLAPDATAVRSTLLGAPVAPASASMLERVLMTCFRFDAAHSRYGGVLTAILRGFAVSLIVGVSVLLWQSARRRRHATKGVER